MLKNGKFIKEPPIRIGVHYVPTPKISATEEEKEMQQVLLRERWRRRRPINLGVGGLLVLAYLFFCVIVLIANLIAGKFLE
jgi:hypothetical protein